MSEERGFDVVDRRRVRAEAEEDPEPTAETPETPVEQDPEPETVPHAGHTDPVTGIFGDAPELTVLGILQMSIGLLNEIAWVKMGVIANPMTGQMEKNLPEARKAIDALADMLKHAEADASASDRRELERALADLRINFVRQANLPD